MIKKTNLLLPIIAMAAVCTFSGCVDSDKDLYDSSYQTSNPMGESFVAPDGFDWSTISDIDVTVKVKDDFNGEYDYVVEIYDANPIISKDAHLLLNGVAKKGKNLISKIVVPNTISTIYVKQTTPDKLSSVRAVEVSDGTVVCDFNASLSSTRSLAKAATRGFVTVESIDGNDTSIFPTQCPAEVTTEFNSNNFEAGHSYKVMGNTETINLWKENIKLYVAEDITLSRLYLTTGSHLYILPNVTVTISEAADNGQKDCLISIGKNATLQVRNKIQLDSNYKLYNQGTIQATTLTCTNSSIFYNLGTATISGQLNPTNELATIVNEGKISAGTIVIEGGGHIINRETVDAGNTTLNCTHGSWENDGKWTTTTMAVSAWNEFCKNKCQLIVEEELKLQETYLIVDGDGSVRCATLYANNTRIDLGAQSLFEVAEKATFGYNTSDRGFKGTGTDVTKKALLVMEEAVAEYPNNSDMIHYAGNLQILCSTHPGADLGWGKRWTLTGGAEWAEEGTHTVSIPATKCNGGGYGQGTPDPEGPKDPEYPIEMDDTQKYTYLFEDQWPIYGDYDMNDLVITIRERKLSINKENLVKEFKLELDLSAVGATKVIGGAIMLDEVSAEEIKKAVEFNKNCTYASFDLNNWNIENGQDKAVIPLFDNAHAILEGRGYEPINTIVGSQNNTTDVKNVSFSIKFDEPLALEKFNINKLNVFIIVGENNKSRREIHVIGFKPTNLSETNIFGNNNDGSSITDNKFYVSKDNLAWGIMVPTDFKWPLEYTKIQNAYPKFESWVKSGGEENKDWMNDFDQNKVYQKK